jgi:hypothetical protein
MHEAIHEIFWKKMALSYDKVKWPFLLQALRMKGFLTMWCDWVARFVQGECGY